MEVKEYYLYIDESGTFEGGREDSSLVGGVLCESNLANESTANKLINSIRDKYIIDGESMLHDTNPRHPYNVDLSFCHATQLPYSIKFKAKLDMVEEILTAGYRPVIFQQDRSTYIKNSTETYLIFLADGIVKLMQDLSIDGPYKLNIVIEERKDTGGKNKNKKFNDGRNYIIRSEDVKNEIYKFISIAKIKNPDSFVHEPPIPNIKMANKNNKLLVLSDYVCNLWYTQNHYLDGENLEEYTQFRKLAEQYKNKYSLCSMNIYSLLNKHLKSDEYMDVLLISMTIDKKTYKLDEFIMTLQDKLANTKLPIIELELERYLAKFEYLIDVKRACHQAIEMLNRTENALDNPKILREYYYIFMTKLYIWKMAAFTHLGMLDEFKKSSDICDGYIDKAQDINLYLSTAIRRVVNLQDQLNFDKSLALGRELLLIIKKLRNSLKEIEILSGHRFTLYDDYFGRLCGSLVWTCSLMNFKSKEILEEGRAYSESAIASFRRQEDKARQYQYRSELEAKYEHYREAVYFLEKGLNLNIKVKDSSQYRTLGDFGWYHLSKILSQLLWKGSSEDATVAKIAFRASLPAWKNYKKNVGTLYHPVIITYTKIALCYAYLGNYSPALDLVKSAYEAAYNSDSSIISAIALTEHATYLGIRAMSGTVDKDGIESLRYKLLMFEDKWPLEKMQEIFSSWDGELERILEYNDVNIASSQLLRLADTIDF